MTDQPDVTDAIRMAADELVPQLAERLRTHGLAEIEVSHGELRLRVAATSDAAPSTPGTAVAGQGAPAATAPAKSTAPGGSSGSEAAGGSVGVASPAVGYFVYADGLGPGLGVASGDALGYVEMLGVRHDVRAPRGGTVRHLVAEAGEAVEYGQIVLELDPTGSAG